MSKYSTVFNCTLGKDEIIRRHEIVRLYANDKIIVAKGQEAQVRHGQRNSGFADGDYCYKVGENIVGKDGECVRDIKKNLLDFLKFKKSSFISDSAEIIFYRDDYFKSSTKKYNPFKKIGVKVNQDMDIDYS